MEQLPAPIDGMPKQDPPGKKKRGRPRVFNIDLAEKIFEVARLGATDEQICRLFDVSLSTLNSWKKSPTFYTNLMKAKAESDLVVEAAMRQRAIGMTVVEMHAEQVMTGKDAGRLVHHRTEKQIPPDVQAGFRWLYNRQPGRWKEKPVHVIQDNRTVIQGNFSPEQITAFVQEKFGQNAKAVLEAVFDVLDSPDELPPPDSNENGGASESPV